MRRALVLLPAALFAASAAVAQVPVRPDTVVRDSSRAARLPEIEVTRRPASWTPTLDPTTLRTQPKPQSNDTGSRSITTRTSPARVSRVAA
jgi:hypothetical protein